jgi:hypothetical protein
VKKVVPYLLAAVAFVAAFYGVQAIKREFRDPPVVEELPADRLDAMMVKEFIPNFEKEARKSIKGQPEMTYVATKWVSGTRTVLTVAKIDWMELPETEGATLEEVRAAAEETREETLAMMPEIIAELEADMVEYMCARSSEWEAHRDYQHPEGARYHDWIQVHGEKRLHGAVLGQADDCGHGALLLR